MDVVMEERSQNNTLKVKMFGEFSMSYQGRPLTDGRVRETHFICMMQILLHNLASGVSRDLLEEVLFGDGDSENRHHLMQSVVYNAKKKLRKWGLPDVNYITFKNGIFYWNQEIAIEEDAAEFDRLCQKAKASEDPEEKLDFYMKALQEYSGEFLSTYASLLWAASEARRYREQFCECVVQAAELMRGKQDYLALEELGKYASAISPFSDWEVLSMEAMVSMGRYEEARNFYASISDRYLRKRGIHPSPKMMETMDKLGDKMMYSHSILSDIQSNLAENAEDIGQGYVCSYPVFQGIYRMINRMMERSGQSVYLMLCTIVDGKGNPIAEGEKLEEMSKRLGEAICRSVRHGDVVNRYGNGQYLVLLINTTQENCEIVQKRINQNFAKGRQRSSIQYHVNSVLCDP